MNQPNDNGQSVWRLLVNRFLANSDYESVLDEFLADRENKIEIMRIALRGKDKKTAIAILKYMNQDDLILLFNELVFLASFGHGAVWSIRQAILSIPKDWVLTNIEKVSEPLIVNGDYDTYRRFLELYENIDFNLCYRLALRAASSPDSDIKEAGEEYLCLLNKSKYSD